MDGEIFIGSDRGYKVYFINMTESAIDVFGDIVDKAYMVGQMCYNEDDELDQDSINNKFNYANTCGNGIQYDADNFYVEFKNGRIVRFSASEWASIEVVK